MTEVPDTDPRLDAAASALADRDYRRAHGHCLEVLTIDPGQGRAYTLLGILTADHGNHAKAVELFDRAIARRIRADALAHKARSLIALNRKDAAIEAADAAVAAAAPEGEDALTWDTIGVVLSRAGLHARAVDFYDRAIARQPGHGPFHYNRAAALQFMGAFSDAAAGYRQAAALDPSDQRSLPAAAMLTRQTAEHNDIEALEALFQQAKHMGDADGQLHAGHALAKVHEDMRDPPAAMAWLRRAKAEKRRNAQYHAAGISSLFAAAHDALHRMAPDIDGSSPADGPVFVVGMPRTGTTLVDRILTSHSAVEGAGELADFGVILKRMAGTPSPLVLDADTLAAQPTVDAGKMGTAYLDSVARTQGLRGRFTDKMPLNLFYVPLILSAVPGARVVCLSRHPADTVLSNYRQLFATGFSYYTYAYDLEWTAKYTAQFYRLLAAYQAHLPEGRFLRVRYEDVVEDQEGQTRRLLAFAGLPFEGECLRFEENTAPVATASATQVRQPLYRSALGRWRRYRPALDPALKILVAEGLIEEGDLGDL